MPTVSFLRSLSLKDRFLMELEPVEPEVDGVEHRRNR
jgi:hypothetical protein